MKRSKLGSYKLLLNLPQFFDCPGLEDGAINDERYLQDIARNCENLGLVIFCVSMTAPRANLTNEASALSSLTQNLGVGIWENTIVCLTFGNMLERRIISRKREVTALEVKNEFDKKCKSGVGIYKMHLSTTMFLNK